MTPPDVCFPCEACGEPVRGSDTDGYAEAHVAHVRAAHPDWPYGDAAVRAYARQRVAREAAGQ